MSIIHCFRTNLQPDNPEELTVDPVQDDIEIVNDGEGTDAFAVRFVFLTLPFPGLLLDSC